MRDYYKILENPLGIGSYGEVRKCYYKDDITDKTDRYKEYRAVKVMSKSYMEEKNVQDFRNEVDLNLQLSHPNITKVYEWFEDPKRYMLVVELVKGGELFDQIQEKGHFEYREAGIILKQLVSAIRYMHGEEKVGNKITKPRCVHRDLKPENVLINDTGDQIPEIKLIDFGTAKRFVKKEDHTGQERACDLYEKVGTLAYMAPEILATKKVDPFLSQADREKLQPFEDYFYTEKCDIWSIGVIAYVLLCGKAPFPDEDNIKYLIDKIKGFEEASFNGMRYVDNDIFQDDKFLALYDDTLENPDESPAVEFIKACLKRDPKKRWSAEQLAESKYMRDIQRTLIGEITVERKAEGYKDELDRLEEAATEEKNLHVAEAHKIAKAGLKSLISFKNQKFSEMIAKMADLTDKERKKVILREASMAMIAHLFIDNRQKTVLKKIFRIMDDSGDGQLQAEEIKVGIQAIFDGEPDLDDGNRKIDRAWTNQELEQAIKNVDHNQNGFLDYKDFLIASIDLSKESFLKYCERAFERFFNNDSRVMLVSDLYEVLCREKIASRGLIQAILEEFDEDGSDSISFQELVCVFLDNLQDDIPGGLAWNEVKMQIELKFQISLPSEHVHDENHQDHDHHH